MKYFYTLVLAVMLPFFAVAQQVITYSVNPVSFDETDPITVTFNVNEAAYGVATSHALYLWAWSIDTNNVQVDCPTNGTWTASNPTNKLSYVSSSAGTGTYTYTMNTVKSFYGNRANPLSKIGFLVKTINGNVQSQDILLNVGKFQFNLTNPLEGSTNVVTSGTIINVTGTSSLPANYVIKANGTPVYTSSSASTSLNFPYTVTQNAAMEVISTGAASGTVVSKSFTISLSVPVQTATIPSYMRQGISYDPNDPTKVGLALYAPLKPYVHVIGSFNNWAVNANYLMKRDTTNPDLYWLEITGLTPQQVYTFQYRTADGIKVADPYSPLVLSPYDDPYINQTSNVYPNLPVYPAGQNFEVSVIQTAKPAYNWTITSFAKPAKENLIVYELLVRDFTTQKTWQALIDKVAYLKSLKINAVELMPVMEFDGNSSWGYNTAFHYALDKAYGTPEKFKEFIDLCHQNGIAIILDIALNHATGRSPIERMWMIDPDGDGFGDPAADNPYFNQVAKHSYSVFNDFNHSKPETKYYVNRVLEQWIKEYKVDGFRWDLTKGFTQNCTANDQACTNAYQQDRVDILKGYADKQWSYDPTSYIIFEHLGSDNEEQQWANYRISEGKGVMMWDKETNPYNQNTMGYASDSNFSRVNFSAHGFSDRRAMSYGESHDEERLMYKNLTYGASAGSYNVKDLATSLERQKAYAAVFLTVPGPKMIWQFAELGFDKSIFTCENGTVNTDTDSTPGDCKLDPKSSAFGLNYDTNAARKSVYDTWAKILELRLSSDVFNTKTFTVESGNLMPRIYISNATTASALKNVVVLANFTLTSQNIVPDFPYTGSWYNLMDNNSFTVSSTNAPITIEPGGFRIFGNASALATNETGQNKNAVSLSLTTNPVSNGTATIRYTNAKSGSVAIYDMVGTLVKTVQVSKDNGDENISINGLKTGMYLMQLKSEKGVAVTKMIVK
ncbi:alpha-amylase family glycosyl hydrolase [Kaistella jeonii]|uniref:Alpha-amylase n=1 Tax=Kaistella jeonii TaxID=266749 RepID=A0A0C1CUR6_9FLAO|nr:alpha-amylase family glycosyl hydrolase [Kaistella jeonii]KIA88026.1 alpha-amylase [Kaistella jeonii]SFC30725.1 Por secretion system C-terminal sorting domain-containing protein [Kaistella jeonii]VEI95567.1 Malto-oligosyltrehalose trehalohydrolase [Kaistella jeonii]